MRLPDPDARPGRAPVTLALVLVLVLVGVGAVLALGRPHRPEGAPQPPVGSSSHTGVDPLATTGASVPCESTTWGCARAFGAWVAERELPGDGEPRVMVIGDSLVESLENRLADSLVGSGVSTFSAGVGGSAFWQWNTGQYLGGDLRHLTRQHEPDDVVLALGNNDARILGSGLVTAEQVRGQISWGLAAVAAESTGCVVVVSPADWPVYAPQSAQVRTLIAEAVTAADAGQAKPRFVVADWYTYSLAHPEWRVAGDVHLTEAGKVAYTQFLTERTRAAETGALGC